MRAFFLLTVFVSLVLSCKPKLVESLASHSDFVIDNSTSKKTNRCCRQAENYRADQNRLHHTSIKTIRLNFHVMRNGKGKGNFSKNEGDKFIKAVVEEANNYIRTNEKMHLPLDNITPVFDPKYQYRIARHISTPSEPAIYYHDDEELYYMISRGRKKNNYSKDVYQKYGIQTDSVLNVFVMNHHQDSVRSSTYRITSAGISFGKWIKVNSWHHGASKSKPNSKSKVVGYSKTASKSLNHEIGHSLGLHHTWSSNDGCDDTPKNPNCWIYSDKPPCDSLWSNNVMDYNAFKTAWTPCQIGRIHQNFQNKKWLYGFLDKSWCNLDTSQNINILDTVSWKSSKNIMGNIVIHEGARLSMYCKLTMPENGSITVKPGGRLDIIGGHIYQDCEKTWQGIFKQSLGNNSAEVNIHKHSLIQNILHQDDLRY